MKGILYLLYLVSVSLGSENWDNNIGQIHPYLNQDIAKKIWNMPAKQAALAVANQFKRKEEIFKIGNKIKSIRSGYISYGGINGLSFKKNRLIRFGENPVEYQIEYSGGHQNYTHTKYVKNKSNFVCTRKTVSKQTLLACEMAQHYRYMIKISKPETLAIHSDIIMSTPPVYYQSLQIYTPDGKRIRWQEDQPNQKALHGFNYSWVSNYAEVMLRKSQEFNSESATKNSNLPSQRKDMLNMIREILQDEHLPRSFALSIVKGINLTCLAQLHQDLATYSKKIPPVSAYVKRLHLMEQDPKAKRNGTDYSGKNITQSESDIIHLKLRKQFSKDTTQLLRKEIDHTLSCLKALGNESLISELIENNVNVEHLIYDMSFRNRDAFINLSLKQLKSTTDPLKYSQPIYNLINAGETKALLNYLEKVDDLKFSQCSRYAATEIRKHKPSWKQKLQAALIRYAKENKDSGSSTYLAIQELIPEDNPRYFNLKLIGECLSDPKVKQKIIDAHWENKPYFYNELLKKWQKLQ